MTTDTQIAVVRIKASEALRALRQPEIADLLAKGLGAAGETDARDCVRDLRDGSRQLWVVASADVPDRPLAVFTTSISEHEGGKRVACVSALGGADVTRWARALGDTVTAWARAQGCRAVWFAGKAAWGRLVPECHPIATADDVTLFERAA